MNEQELYKKMCSRCPYSKKCHDDATMCDEYAIMVNKITGIPSFVPKEHEILCWLNDFKDYKNLDEVIVKVGKKKLVIKCYRNEQCVESYEEDIENARTK